MTTHHQPILLSGSSHPRLASAVARYLGIETADCQLEQFPDGEIHVELMQSVRGSEVFVLQTLAMRPNHYLMELLILIDALKRGAAASIVPVIPYFGYARQDRRNNERVAITARLVANLLERAGAHHVLTVDLHAEQIQGFFDSPVDNLFAREVLIQGLEGVELGESVVVSPDVGSIKVARAFATLLQLDFVTIDKRRLSPTQVEVAAIIGEVKGKDALLVDDMCSTGGTLVAAAEACKRAGCRRVLALVTHGLLVGEAVERIRQSPIERLIVTDTVPEAERWANEEPKIQLVSVANLIGEAVSRVSQARSVAALFAK